MTNYYKTFGLNIQSEIELPELLPSTNNEVDVIIKTGQVPSELTNCLKKGVTYEIGANEFLFEIFDVARFYITNGEQIIVEPKEESTPDDIRLFLLGTCLGAILHQRQILPVHASAIVHNGEAVLFMGATGTGKSTIATAFRLKGYEMITDDVCPVRIIDGKPFAIPGYPQSKLCEDTMDSLFIDKAQYKLIREGIGKRAVRYQEGFATEPIKIKACYMLKSGTDVASIELIQMKDSDKFTALKSNIYRSHIPEGMNLQLFLLTTISQIANQCAIKVLKKTEDSTIQEIFKLFESDLKSLKNEC
jgi:hypothetical protein